MLAMKTGWEILAWSTEKTIRPQGLRLVSHSTKSYDKTLYCFRAMLPYVLSAFKYSPRIHFNESDL